MFSILKLLKHELHLNGT